MNILKRNDALRIEMLMDEDDRRAILYAVTYNDGVSAGTYYFIELADKRAKEIDGYVYVLHHNNGNYKIVGANS